MSLLLRPNPASGVPVYLQVMDQLRQSLQTGAIQPGDALPEVQPLAEALVVHPNAVARAYRELEGQRLVTRRSGVLSAAARPTAPARNLVSSLTAENARLSAQVAADAADRARQARELDTARDVQQRLLPQSCPAIDGVDYAGCSRAALGVGGDYYDFVALPNHQLAIALGDVCGKGMPAALLMATLRAYLHSELARPDANPSVIVATLNRRLHESAPSNRFATFFYAQYDVASRALTYVNAGHTAPIVIRGGGDARRVIRLDASSVALGWIADPPFTTLQLTLEPGDLLVAFSDGISEAMTSNGDEWGESRLLDTIDTRGVHPASALVDGVFTAIDAFTAGGPQHDDMTLVVMRVM